jgi:hypothetical protein
MVVALFLFCKKLKADHPRMQVITCNRAVFVAHEELIFIQAEDNRHDKCVVQPVDPVELLSRADLLYTNGLNPGCGDHAAGLAQSNVWDIPSMNHPSCLLARLGGANNYLPACRNKADEIRCSAQHTRYDSVLQQTSETIILILQLLYIIDSFG